MTTQASVGLALLLALLLAGGAHGTCWHDSMTEDTGGCLDERANGGNAPTGDDGQLCAHLQGLANCFPASCCALSNSTQLISGYQTIYNGFYPNGTCQIECPTGGAARPLPPLAAALLALFLLCRLR